MPKLQSNSICSFCWSWCSSSSDTEPSHTTSWIDVCQLFSFLLPLLHLVCSRIFSRSRLISVQEAVGASPCVVGSWTYREERARRPHVHLTAASPVRSAEDSFYWSMLKKLLSPSRVPWNCWALIAGAANFDSTLIRSERIDTFRANGSEEFFYSNWLSTPSPLFAGEQSVSHQWKRF